MNDNEILKYYRRRSTKDGFAIIKQKNFQLLGRKQSLHGCQELSCKHGIYYAKPFNLSCDTFEKSKREMDAEILLPHLYNHCGVPSAFSVPVSLTNQKNSSIGKYLFSNDVSTDSSLLAIDYYKELSQSQNESDYSYFIFNELKYKPEVLTPQAIQQFARMRLLDTITCNDDRNPGNYILDFDKEGNITELKTFDHEASSNGLMYFQRRFPDLSKSTINDSRNFFLTFYQNGDFLEIIKQDTSFSLLDVKDFIQNITTINLKETSEQIEEETQGYKIDPDYIEFLNRNIDIANEELTQ